ncbi:DUF2853 family protein [Ovoidimarina sediminis]|uniref:DUF2853 family protein n=1 Tax=Ovoidimarina sediminis TaxID=3079856 RepID=UPI00290E120B|nr:DUF2853 family protein [Rhodophyticola sp. MJ-SS7]MDU8942507.1 DUF2853 family protein [Rhodophyticola sp. MJ-SS7]
MGRRAELTDLYARELREKCGVTPDPALLEAVVLGCGPLIYNAKTAVIDPDSEADLAQVRENFLIRKLALRDGPELDDTIEVALSEYGAPDDPKHRAVLYYLLTRHFGREDQVFAAAP